MTDNPFSLAGGHVVVIGASRGIGAGVAQALATAGAAVTVTARSIEALDSTREAIEAAGGTVWAASCEVTDADAVETLLAEADRRRPVTALVVAAGVSARHELLDMPDEAYRTIIETNLTGSLNAARAAARVMGDRGGSVVLFGSLASHYGMNFASAYAASKGAVVQLGKSLAVEWAERGIRVNIVAPGFVQTEMTKVSLSMPERRRWILERTPFRRFGEPREIAEPIVFLVSEAASFITGQVLYIDGGFTAGSQW